MIVSIIAAMDRKRGIGVDNKLPWRLSADLKKFRELTMGHHIVVGRKTFESIGKPLPGRRMIIVTRDRTYKIEGCDVVHSVKEAIGMARGRGESEAFICGGAEIYAQTIGIADRMYLTFVDAEVSADVFFPGFDESAWVEKERLSYPADENNQYTFTFKLLTRKETAKQFII
ncbi:MAG: dihydrofolate reductase [Blastocatellales bacterium]